MVKKMYVILVSAKGEYAFGNVDDYIMTLFLSSKIIKIIQYTNPFTSPVQYLHLICNIRHKIISLFVPSFQLDVKLSSHFSQSKVDTSLRQMFLCVMSH